MKEECCCTGCKLRPILCDKLNKVFDEMQVLHNKEGETMKTSYVYQEVLIWGLLQLMKNDKPIEELKTYAYQKMEEIFDAVIDQRKS